VFDGFDEGEWVEGRDLEDFEVVLAVNLKYEVIGGVRL